MPATLRLTRPNLADAQIGALYPGTVRTMSAQPRREEVVLDGRRRTSLARVGAPGDTRYIAETLEDGSVLLTPAVLVEKWELAALSNPEIRGALDGALTAAPDQLVSRGSFAAYADDEPR